MLWQGIIWEIWTKKIHLLSSYRECVQAEVDPVSLAGGQSGLFDRS